MRPQTVPVEVDRGLTGPPCSGRTPAVRRVLHILLLGWVALGITGSGAYGVVICVGSDGHMALELAHADHCETACHGANGDEGLPSALATPATPGGCGSCIDVTLQTNGDPVATRDTATRTAPGTETGALQVVGASLPHPDHNRVTPPSRPDLSGADFLQAQRTVVLRI